MKKLVLGVCLCWGLTQAYAQNANQAMKSEHGNVQSDKAEILTNQLMQDLKLNEHQYVKVKEINKSRLKQMQDIEVQYVNNPEKRDESMKQLEMKTDKQLAAVLSPDQLTSYMELQGRGGQETIENKKEFIASENSESEDIKNTNSGPAPSVKYYRSQSRTESMIEQRSYEYQE